MLFTFNSYNIIEFQKDTLLVSNCGAIKITSRKLITALKDIKSETNTSIDGTTLTRIIKQNKLPAASTSSFLKAAINLKARPSKPYYNKTLIIHDWPEPDEFEEIVNQELNLPYEFCYDDNALTQKAENECHFIEIINTQYDYKRIKNIYFKLAKAAPKSAISVSFLNGNLFHVGQPYTANIGNPCHFCIINRKLHYERRNASQNNWSSLLKFCCDRNVATPSQHLNLLKRNLIIGATIRQIKQHTNEDSTPRFQDNAINSTTVNLDTGALIDEVIPHWHACDCLRP